LAVNVLNDNLNHQKNSASGTTICKRRILYSSSYWGSTQWSKLW